MNYITRDYPQQREVGEGVGEGEDSGEVSPVDGDAVQEGVEAVPGALETVHFDPGADAFATHGLRHFLLKHTNQRGGENWMLAGVTARRAARRPSMFSSIVRYTLSSERDPATRSLFHFAFTQMVRLSLPMAPNDGY